MNIEFILNILPFLFAAVATIAPFIVLFIAIIIYFKKNNLKSTKKADEHILVDMIKKTDPNFDVEKFKENAKQSLLAINNYLSTQEIENLMSLESTALFNIHKKDIELAIASDLQNIVEYESIGNIEITQYNIDGEKEVIGCGVWVTTKNIKLIPSTKQVVTYDTVPTTQKIYLEFLRSTSVKTTLGKDFAVKNCPNCGAMIEMNAQGKCIYCDSLLINGEHSWALNKIETFYMYM